MGKAENLERNESQKSSQKEFERIPEEAKSRPQELNESTEKWTLFGKQGGVTKSYLDGIRYSFICKKQTI